MHFERFESALWRTSSLLLVDGDEAVAIDPCISRSEVEAIAAHARELGVRVTHVLATHADWDHVCGHAVFPDAVSTVSEASAVRIASGEPALTIAEEARKFQVEVAGSPRYDLVLEVGDAHRIGRFAVETTALPGHTPDGTAYRVRALDLLAIGDHLSPDEYPLITSTSAYRSTLATLIELLENDPPAHVVPGHGPTMTAAVALAIAREDLAYLRALHAAVAGALADGTGYEGARAAGLTVKPPRQPPDELDEHDSNVAIQIAELLAPEDSPGRYQT
jgi:glyoxylase-like metal-dependent hydrolase (beta-lactamase superfamily II)